MSIKTSKQEVFSLDEQIALFDKLPADARIRIIKSLSREKLEELDGKTFINMGSPARSNLGRMLQSTSHSPFDHVNYGRFASIEGFWWWIKSVERDDRMRTLAGAAARRMGQSLTSTSVRDFKLYVIRAIWAKVTQNKPIFKSLMASGTTPIVSFYYSGNMNVPTVDPATSWVMKSLEIMRSYLLVVGLDKANFEEIEDYICQCVYSATPTPPAGRPQKKPRARAAIPATWQEALRIKREAELAAKPKAAIPEPEVQAESTSPVDEVEDEGVICGGPVEEEVVVASTLAEEVPEETPTVQS